MQDYLLRGGEVKLGEANPETKLLMKSEDVRNLIHQSLLRWDKEEETVQKGVKAVAAKDGGGR